jgi:hypothetical protein
MKDRSLGDDNADIESPSLKDVRESRIVSIPIGSDPDTDEDDDDDPATPQDAIVERWLNAPARARS